MNPLLRDLLAEGVAKIGAQGPGRWRGLTVVNSVGPIPLPEPARHGWQADRGFNVLLDDGAGHRSYFGKCRDVADATFARETELIERLCRSAAGDGILPPACGVERGPMRLQLSAYVHGTPLNRLIRRMPDARWEAVLHEVIRTADSLSAGAREASVGILPESRELSIPAEGEAALASLAGAGLEADLVAVLARALDADRTVQSRPQHGDLWASNVLQTDRGWMLLDLEFFGMIEMPLYDAAHFVKTTSQMRTTPAEPWDAPRTPWSRLLRNDTVEAVIGRRALAGASARLGLTARASTACAVYYLCESTARLLMQATPAALVEPVVADLADFARSVRDGIAAERLLGFA
jgi:hypothetical protein